MDAEAGLLPGRLPQQLQRKQLAAVHRKPARVPEIIQRAIRRITQGISAASEFLRVVIGKAELQQIDSVDFQFFQPGKNPDHFRFGVGHRRHFHHHAGDKGLRKRHILPDLFAARRRIVQFDAEADFFQARIPQRSQQRLIQKVSGCIEAKRRLRPEFAGSPEILNAVFRVQKRFSSRQRNITHMGILTVQTLQFAAPVLDRGGIILEFRLVGIKTEKAVSVTHQGENPRIAVHARPAGLTGPADTAVNKACAAAALRNAERAQLRPQAGKLVLPTLREGQAELLHLCGEAVVNVPVLPQIFPQDRIPYVFQHPNLAFPSVDRSFFLL